MSRFSRNKGKRGEQELVLYLKARSYHAERVLNQAHTAGLYDVVATKNGKTYSFELKTYKDAFKTVYQFYYNTTRISTTQGGHILGALLPDNRGLLISTDFEALLDATDVRFWPPADKKQERLYKRFLTLDGKRGKADFLVLRDNNRPRLFLKFWG